MTTTKNIIPIFTILFLFCNQTFFARVEFNINKYNDVQAIVTESMKSTESFDQELIDSLEAWKKNKYKAIWFTIPKEHATCIPIALNHGFIFHHTTTEKLVMIRALQKGAESMLPAYATQTLGAMGLVIDQDNNVLVVKDRFNPQFGYKLPGGGADFSENIGEAAMREVKEETGIDCEFLGIVAWRHGRQAYPEGISDMCFCCLLRPISHEINKQESEITDACWMPYDEFKKIAQDIAAQFLAAYEAHGTSYICCPPISSELLDLYAPSTIDLTQINS